MTTTISKYFVALTDEEIAGITSDRPAVLQIMGRKRVAEKVRRVTLANGRKLFKCAACNYASTRGTSIPPHQRVHTVEEFETGSSNGQVATPPSVTLTETTVVDSVIVSTLQRFIDERNERVASLEAENENLRAALASIRSTAEETTR